MIQVSRLTQIIFLESNQSKLLKALKDVIISFQNSQEDHFQKNYRNFFLGSIPRLNGTLPRSQRILSPFDLIKTGKDI